MVKRKNDSAISALNLKKAGKKQSKKQSKGAESLSADITLKLLRKLENQQIEHQQKNNEFDTVDLPDNKTLHGIKLHELELEAQNEAFREVNLTLAATLKKYTFLYESAPSAYLTINKAGNIINLNPAAAKLLGNKLSRLINRNFNQFLDKDSQTNFDSFLQKTYDTNRTQSCICMLTVKSGVPMFFLFEGLVPKNKMECQLIVVTIPDAVIRKSFGKSIVKYNTGNHNRSIENSANPSADALNFQRDYNGCTIEAANSVQSSKLNRETHDSDVVYQSINASKIT